ncbi:MAG: TonB-dependent siderophore receptor [Pseudomonadota bacterium]
MKKLPASPSQTHANPRSRVGKGRRAERAAFGSRATAFGSKALLALLASAVSAQSSSQDEPSIMEEVIVHGQQIGYYDTEASSALRQQAPILETPASVFLINAELMADQQSFRMDQILQNDSSVQKSNNFLGAYSSFQVRGFALSNGSNYFRDGRPFFHLASPATEILDRVEVLKGPASVLYGTLAPGGIVNLVSKAPPSELSGFVKATFGSFDLAHYHLDVGGPATKDGSLRYRVNAVSEDSNSFRRFYSGEEFGSDRMIFSGALAWDLSANTTLLLNADYLEDDRPQDNGLIGEDGEIISSLDYDTIYNQAWSLYDSEVGNIFLQVDHRFSDSWGAKFVVHQQEYQRDRYDNQLLGVDNDAGDFTIRARRRLNRRDYTNTSLDINGEFFTGGLKHRLLVGVERTDIDRNDREISGGERVTFVSNINGPAIPDPLIGVGNVLVRGEERRRGVFAQDMIEVGEQWRVLLGLRYDEFETNIGNGFETDNVTPRFGVLYLLNEAFAVYSTYSESFEPNGPVGGGFENTGEQLDPTVGEQIELGAKLELYDGNLLLTGALFAIERDGAPFEDPVRNVIVQRGLQENEGFEFSAAGLIGDHLSVVASFTYLDAEFTRDDNPDIVGNVPFGVTDFAFSLWAEYQFNAGTLQGLSLQGGLFYESDRPVDDLNTFDLDAYTRVDIGAKYEFELEGGQGLVTRLTISNLTDEEYFKARSPFAINPELPREIRASVQYRF